MTEETESILEKMDLDICIKEDNICIQIPKEIINQNQSLIKDYIRIYKAIENLKIDMNKYLFDKNSTINELMLVNQILKIKREENLDLIIKHLNLDIKNIENKLKQMCLFFNIDIESIENEKEKIIQNFINTKEELQNIIEEDYVSEVIQHIENNPMYSLKEKSRYGAISNEYNIKNKECIIDTNEEEKNGQYSPILVIYRAARYDRGTYMLDDKYHVYIKRQPLEALINQEGLESKGTDSMGAIIYKKLKYDLSNENLQELLSELYIYAQKNNLKFENIKLSDINDNNVWMTGDKLKKEFKELRYYHKNLTQKIKEIYDSRGSYYTQIGGKYIFNTREFLSSYKTYKSKEINNK